MSTPRSLQALALMALGCACASTTIPRDKLAASQGSIRAAEEMGAEQVPQASLYLEYARTQAKEAQELYKKGDDEHATTLLLRAEADAKVALAITRTEPLKNEATEAEKKLQAFQDGHP